MEYMKMAIIAMMALALLSCSKKDEPKKAESAVLRICINDSGLRALGADYANGDKTECMINVVLTPDNSVTIKPENQDLADVKNLQKGYGKEVSFAVNTVALTTNGAVGDSTKITSFQGKSLKTEIPLEVKATAVTTVTASGQTVYSVTLKPVPHVIRAKVLGRIKPRESEATHKSAFESITVEHVYANSYLSTRTEARHPCVTSSKGGFRDDPAVETAMNDEIKAANLDEFVAGMKVAGYQLFLIEENEATGTEFYDYVILKIKIEYSGGAIAAKPEFKKMTERYATMARFIDAAAVSNPAIVSFKAGKIYKLNLKDLNDDFKAGDDDTPGPSSPDTPGPEPDAK